MMAKTMTKELPSILIRKSVSLIKELNLHYGPEKGHAAWEGLCDALDDDNELKYAIFQLMLTGEVPADSILFRSWDSDYPGQNKVSCIKWARRMTNIGLKEAKELIEGIDSNREYQVYKGTSPMRMFEISSHYFLDEDSGERINPNYKLWGVEASDLGLDIEFI